MTATTNADNTQVSAGQMFPDDWNDEFSVMIFVCRQLIAEMETMTPVQVSAVHAGSGTPPVAGTVDVQLLVSLLDGNLNATQQGIVYGLPYFRLQGGPWSIVCDPVANDFGFIVAASRDISNVVATPGVANPGSLRKHSFSDGIFIPAPLSSAVPAATLWLKGDGTFVLTSQDGVVLKSDGSGNLDVTATTLNLTGNLAVTGSITATAEITRGVGGSDSVTLGNHRHAGNNLAPTPGT